jgi:hypothetical protein
VKLNISLERYSRQFIALCAAGFTDDQANRLILRRSSEKSVFAVLDNFKSLNSPPYNLSKDSVVKIAGNNSGARNIKAVKSVFTNKPIVTGNNSERL